MSLVPSLSQVLMTSDLCTLVYQKQLSQGRFTEYFHSTGSLPCPSTKWWFSCVCCKRVPNLEGNKCREYPSIETQVALPALKISHWTNSIAKLSQFSMANSTLCDTWCSTPLVFIWPRWSTVAGIDTQSDSVMITWFPIIWSISQYQYIYIWYVYIYIYTQLYIHMNANNIFTLISISQGITSSCQVHSWRVKAKIDFFEESMEDASCC